ncbi:hypothetical protein BDAP_000091, partial [Binucleata daphniae]
MILAMQNKVEVVRCIKCRGAVKLLKNLKSVKCRRKKCQKQFKLCNKFAQDIGKTN